MRRLAWCVLLVGCQVGCGTSAHPAAADAAVDDAGGADASHEPEVSVGTACGAGSPPCPGVLACIESDRFPGGYCSLDCAADACGFGAVCEDVFGARLCLRACTAPADCRDGYQCWAGACRPRCAEDAECGASAICESGVCVPPRCAEDAMCASDQRCASGRCVPRPILPEGAACTRGLECTSGICLPSSRGGTCARACTRRSECGTATCTAVPVDTNGDGRTDRTATACAPRIVGGGGQGWACASDRACETGLCIEGECAQVCGSDADCLTGQRCTMRTAASAGGSFMGCGYAPISAPVVETLHLGGDRVFVGREATATFAIPEDAVSVTLRVQQLSGEVRPLMAFSSVLAPDGRSVFDLAAISRWEDQPNRWLVSQNAFDNISMQIPNSTPDRIAIQPGRYDARYAVYPRSMGDVGSTADVRLDAIIKRAPGGVVTRGVLDLNLHFVGVAQTAATAPRDTTLIAALSALAQTYAAVGITLGQVRYFDVSNEAAATLSIIDSSDGSSSELAQLFRLSAPRTENAVNVFFVRMITTETAGGDGVTLGIAGGIPGPYALHGTGHSGVVIASEMTSGRGLGLTMAHEIGHYLGLYHSRESGTPCADGTGPTTMTPCAPFGGVDPIADTPGRTASFNEQRSNLMFWSALGGTTLSTGQGFVMLRNPIVR